MRLWIERGFSRLPIAERMLAAQPDLELFTSPSQTPDGATPLVMPKLSDDQRVAGLNAVVSEHRIDAFWPQGSAAHDLTGLSCTVHAAGTPETVALVDDKDSFMKWLGDDPYRPDQIEVMGADGVEAEYARRQAQGRTVCVKPVIGVNGSGYWKLLPNGGFGFLDDPEPREMDASMWITAMRGAEREGPRRRLLVMDWLPGPEVSIDLLCWNGTPLIHAARTKIDANHQRIEGEHVVTRHSHSVARLLGLHGIVSMQYRLDGNGAWRMLEVNPRPAGGSIHSEDAGFGIITDWTHLVTGAIGPEDVKQREAAHTVRFVRTANIL
jgi:hypothetical protein